MTEENLLEMEKRFTRMDNPRLIAEVRELQRDVRVIRGAAELSAQECLNLRGQLAEAKEEIKRLELQRDQARERYEEMRGNLGLEAEEWQP